MNKAFEKILERLQEARNQLENSCLKVRSKEDCEKYNECGACIMDCAIDIINQVEAEYNNGWIPCKVELPKVPTSYLVAEEVIINSEKLYVVDIRLFGTEDEWLCPSNRKIIAWQPLPKPPKGE